MKSTDFEDLDALRRKMTPRDYRDLLYGRILTLADAKMHEWNRAQDIASGTDLALQERYANQLLEELRRLEDAELTHIL